MAKYIPYDYNQSSMVVINFTDQIQPGTFEHAVHYLVDKVIINAPSGLKDGERVKEKSG